MPGGGEVGGESLNSTPPTAAPAAGINARRHSTTRWTAISAQYSATLDCLSAAFQIRCGRFVRTKTKAKLVTLRSNVEKPGYLFESDTNQYVKQAVVSYAAPAHQVQTITLD